MSVVAATESRKAGWAIANQPGEFVQEVFIGLGSNLGDREEWLCRAIQSLRESADVRLLNHSSLYETEPVGFSGQPRFLNQVIEIATSFPPPVLLEFLLRSERKLGRIRQQRWGPRNIDLDVLAFQQIEMQTGHLILPHPEIARRRFVLAPWCEIAPDFVVPRWNLAVKELLARCADHSGVIMHKQA